MRISFAGRMIVGLCALTLVKPPLMTAGDTHLRTWQNLEQLIPGQEIEITLSAGGTVQGSFIRFGEPSISLRGKQKDITISRTDVTRVRLNPVRRRRYTWIGAALGLGAGAGVGAGIGERVSYESGGDLGNLKPVFIGISAAIGAGVGALVGSMIGGRRATIYVAK